MKRLAKGVVIAIVIVALCVTVGLHMQEVSEIAAATGELAPENSEYGFALEMNANAGFFSRLLGMDPASEYKDGLDRRARMEEAELLALGYSEEEIAVLRAYRDGERGFDEAASLTTAVLDMNVEATELTNERVSVQCKWQWDKAPVGSGEAGVALACYVLTSDASPRVSIFEGTSASVTYCESASGESETVNVEASGSGGHASAVFDTGGRGQPWACSGSITLSLIPAAGSYGSVGVACTAYRYAHTMDGRTQLTWDEDADLFSSGAEAFTGDAEHVSEARGAVNIYEDGTVQRQDDMWNG